MADNAAAPPKPSSSVKLVLLGEAAVGKSSLVLRFVNNDFQENKEPTIGAAFLTQKSHLPHRTIKFEIWDTAGQERFASLAPMYYRNAQSALVVYDLTKPTSLVKAKHWVAELQRQASPGIVIALVGNKLDLTNETSDPGGADTTTATSGEGEGEGADAGEESEDARKISTKEGREYAEEEGLLFFETSAKTGTNVQEVFTAIANAIPETQMKGAKGPGTAGGGTQAALGAERVNLNKKAAEAKEGNISWEATWAFELRGSPSRRKHPDKRLEPPHCISHQATLMLQFRFRADSSAKISPQNINPLNQEEQPWHQWLSLTPKLALTSPTDDTLTTSSSTSTMSTSSTTLAEDFTSPRARKQLTLFLAGASFFTLSTLITRRAVHRKHIWPKPRFYDFSNAPPNIPIVGSVEALEALQIATMNVFSFGIMVAGGLGWGFDVSGVKELKTRIARKRPPVDVDRDPGEEAKELEGLPEWIAGMMGGKDGVVERARDMKRRQGREVGGKVDEIRSRGDGQERARIEESFAAVEERSTDRKEKPWWKFW